MELPLILVKNTIMFFRLNLLMGFMNKKISQILKCIVIWMQQNGVYTLNTNQSYKDKMEV